MEDDGTVPFRSGSHSWKDMSSPIYDGLEVIPTHLNKQHLKPGDKVRNSMSTSSVDSTDSLTKGPYSTYMEKEIMEQAEAVRQSMLGRVDFKNHSIDLHGIENYKDEITRCRRIICIGAASSYHVAVGTRQTMEELLEIPVFVELASDFLDREVPVFRDDVCILISQSGETSSVLSACMYCKERDALVLGITNEENSRLSDETHCGININAGLELGVTSTKTYTCQFITLVMFAICVAGDKRSKYDRVVNIIKEMELLPSKIKKVLELNDSIKSLAESFSRKRSFILLGRGYHQATSYEGSLKLKEIVNVHSEGIHSGELKHGPLALIDDQMPIIMIVMRDRIYEKCMNAVQQVTARGGKPIVICEEGDDVVSQFAHTTICIPKTTDCLSGMLAVIPLQLLALHLAILHGKSVDTPLNIQKTVIEDHYSH